MWLMQTKWKILCLVPVLTVGTWRSTLPREHFKATCFGEVSFPDIIVGTSTEKEGLGRKTMKKRRMMIAILCPLKNSVTLQWKTMKKMELLLSLGKWKMDFSCKENKNFLWQTCWLV